MGHPGVVEAVADSALCLLVGTRLPITARAGLDEALASVPTVSIGSAAPYLPVHACAHRRPARLADAAHAGADGFGRPTGIRVPDAVTRTELEPPPYDGPGVRYRDAMAVLDEILPDGVDIVVDAGNIGAAAIHYLPARRDGRFVVALGMGGMGYSFGAGLGMAMGRARRTVVIAGDGSFFMHGMEIHTALQYGLPVTFVLFEQPRARDVRDPRAAVLRRPLQLQPIPSEPTSARASRRCSPAWHRSTCATPPTCPAPCARHSTRPDRRW